VKIVAVSPSVLHRAAARMRMSVGEQLRNVNGEQQGDQNINRDEQEKSHEGKQNRVTKEQIDSAEKNSREGSTDDGGLRPKESAVMAPMASPQACPQSSARNI
jgi:hypothetical protein